MILKIPVCIILMPSRVFYIAYVQISGMAKMFSIYLLGFCLQIANNKTIGQAIQENGIPSDKNATTETIALYNNLKKLMNEGFMFGHQDDLAYGVGWKYENGRSDIKDVTGDYPAVTGWELGHLEIEKLVILIVYPLTKCSSI